MNKAILIIPVIAILLGITTSTSTTAVQARIYGHYTMTNSNAYDKGFNQAKHDVANNHAYNNSCTPNGVYCQQYDSGYKTAWIQEHWSTGTPYNMQLLMVNKTA